MASFLNGSPKTKAEAIETTILLTNACKAALSGVPACKDARRRSAMIARFNELNEVRMRVIGAWGLEGFAAGLNAR